ncbi:MAG: NYN domain-containing protein [Chitinispirillales bacterium]|jgi:cold shock CspA family protein|nr:NYN domain-containing protein [Chitinispirillales bacterium]
MVKPELNKIGVFYDGNYFLHVSNYYKYSHEKKSRLSLSGLHRFIRNKAAELCGIDEHLCHIVDAHYFRGRVNALDSRTQENGNDILYYERLFDDMLHAEGVTTHYLPVKTELDGSRHEKGIDVLFALEAYELAIYKKFDILALVASDGDYVPLARKLNTIGVKVMLLSWDFEYVNQAGKKSITRTSQALLEEVTFPIAMHEIIDNRVRRNDPIINGLFTSRENSDEETNTEKRITSRIDITKFKPSRKTSTIKAVKEQYGFINNEPEDVFFHWSSVIDSDFSELQIGDTVEFLETLNEKGQYVAKEVRIIESNGNL